MSNSTHTVKVTTGFRTNRTSTPDIEAHLPYSQLAVVWDNIIIGIGVKDKEKDTFLAMLVRTYGDSHLYKMTPEEFIGYCRNLPQIITSITELGGYLDITDMGRLLDLRSKVTEMAEKDPFSILERLSVEVDKEMNRQGYYFFDDVAEGHSWEEGPLMGSIVHTSAVSVHSHTGHPVSSGILSGSSLYTDYEVRVGATQKYSSHGIPAGVIDRITRYLESFQVLKTDTYVEDDIPALAKRLV